MWKRGKLALEELDTAAVLGEQGCNRAARRTATNDDNVWRAHGISFRIGAMAQFLQPTLAQTQELPGLSSGQLFSVSRADQKWERSSFRYWFLVLAQ